MSDPMGIAQPTRDIISVQFDDRSVTIQYIDANTEGPAGSLIQGIVIRPEHEDMNPRIVEIVDDLNDLIAAWWDVQRNVPSTRPGRVQVP